MFFPANTLAMSTFSGCRTDMCRKWRRIPTSWSFLLKWQLRVKKDQVRVIARRGKLKTMGTDTQAQCNFSAKKCR